MKEEFPLVNRVTERGLPPRPVHAIVCSQCPEEDFVSALNSRLPPHTVAARFQRAGWVVRDHGKHLCPACAKARRAAFHSEGVMTTKATVKPAIDDAVKRALPDLYIELGVNYDRDARAYKGGATDATIAGKLGLPEAVVAERRERDFGPLVESEAARRKREAAAAIVAAQRSFRAECDKFEQAQRNAQAAAEAVITAYGSWMAAVAAQQDRAA
jgi:hypothetical protein